MPTSATVRRPQRWDVPFGESMSPAEVERLLRLDIFTALDRSRFPASCRLEDILLNDSRVLQFDAGDIIVREGDYGNSAFILLRGTVRVVLESLSPRLLGRSSPPRKSLLRTFLQGAFPSQYPEVRTYGQTSLDKRVGQRRSGEQTRVFLQDVPGVLDAHHTIRLGAGEIFGEIAAMSRSPRTATVFAEQPAALLEIRWQGLRDIMRRDEGLKRCIDQLYRENSLETHLLETPLLKSLPPETIARLVQLTRFESYGDFAWQTHFKRTRQGTASQRVASEPLICEEGTYVDGLVLIRSGFARMSRRYGDGHRTCAYLGKGQIFGLEEVAYNWQRGGQLPWQSSLRAVGHTDVLRIPTQTIEQEVLPHLPTEDVMRWVQQAESLITLQGDRQGMETGLLEFVLDERILNGTQTMLIDLNRCTRCDDCVRACASTHDNNPRFMREGPTHRNYMIAHACMHCADPVCMIGCPTGAIGREIATGTVLINDLTCIGCGTCAASCPYQNIQMVEIREPGGEFIRDEANQPLVKATKCDLCVGHWGGPACQRACPHDALVRIDFNNPPEVLRWMDRR